MPIPPLSNIHLKESLIIRQALQQGSLYFPCLLYLCMYSTFMHSKHVHEAVILSASVSKARPETLFFCFTLSCPSPIILLALIVCSGCFPLSILELA